MADVPTKQLSDCVESLLCAAFLADGTGKLAVYILNVLDLPSGQPRNSDEQSYWFKAAGNALNGCYPIGMDSNLSCQISQISEILRANPVHGRLKDGQKRLMKILALNEIVRVPSDLVVDANAFDLLLQCALFDDDLMSDIEDSGKARNTDDFLPMVLLRDSLYVVGAWTLQLFICKEFFAWFPKATSNDYHIC
jgi:hypothetical protein